MKRKSVMFIACLVALGSAAAQEQGQGQGRRQDREHVNQSVVQACKAEIQQLCQGKKGQEAQQCLRSNSDKLSSECKNAVSKSPQTNGHGAV